MLLTQTPSRSLIPNALPCAILCFILGTRWCQILMFRLLLSRLRRSNHQRFRWPSRLLLVRHGQSAGNVAADAAHAARIHRVEISNRDADVPLSGLGEQQSLALGQWLADRPLNQRPEVVLSSPYKRACQTAHLIREAGAIVPGAPPLLVDERLREREFGILDRLTARGISDLFPEQAEFKQLLGKFYHRPPGGESWCDVILRLRSTVDMLSLHHPGQRVLIVAHEVIVLCMRYLLEEMDEERIMAIDKQGDVANCALTEYVYRPGANARAGSMVLVRYNETAPITRRGAPVTTGPDVVAAR
jgi:2,3-bisphosphoglycerate-dependent phosphoglycerate mutase